MSPRMALSAAKIHGIFRYPVKGLSPEPLACAQLAVGATLPADRLYAIENGPSGFDTAAPRHQPKQRYLMLMRNERLALLHTRFDENSHVLSIGSGGCDPVRGDLRTAAGRIPIEQFFATYCADELRGPPKVLHAPGFSFSDIAQKAVSIINLASVGAIEAAIGTAVDPLRFRANLYLTGWPAWYEFDLIGEELAFTRGARIKIFKRIVRCAAVNVDPTTGIRDLSIPQELMQRWGHMDCGVYAEVVAGGDIALGDALAG